MGRDAAVRAGGCGRHLRLAGRLPHRPVRPPARAGLEHPALRVLGARRRLLDLGPVVPVLALLHVHRRLRGVRRRGGVALGALHRPQAARARGRLHAGVRLGRRADGDGRVLPDRDLRTIAARGARRTRGVALHADVRRDSGDSPHHHPALPARVADMGGQEARRHAAASELRGAVHAGVPADDDRHDHHDGVRVCGRLRRHSADAAHRAGARGRAGHAAHRAGTDDQRRAVVPGVWRARPDASCWPPSRRSSSAGAGCSSCSRFRA